MKTIFFLFASTICFSQTISKAPIYEGANSFKIHEAEYGFINFFGQNSDYTLITETIYFSLRNKKDAIALIEKAISMLGMEKTEVDQTISDKFQKLNLTRYGFSQNQIHLAWYQDGVYVSLNPFNLQELENIKAALSK